MKRMNGSGYAELGAAAALFLFCCVLGRPARASEESPPPFLVQKTSLDNEPSLAAVRDSAQRSATATTTTQACATTRAPRFVRLTPYRDIDRAVVVRPGHTLKFVVYAEDPTGAPLEYFARGLPQGSFFDSETQVFSWTPESHVKGSFSPIFVASTDELEATLLVRIDVVQNRPPVVFDTSAQFEVGQLNIHEITASDPDQDVLTYSCVGLPKKATCNRDTGRLSFFPGPSDAGQYDVQVNVSDGAVSRSAVLTLIVVDSASERKTKAENEWESYLQPGLGYGFYLPRAASNEGSFHGVDLQISPISWIHKSDERGPSHGRLYVGAQILSGTKSNGPLLFYSLGLSLSLERNPQRNWLIPFYGLEVGGMTHEHLGNRFQSAFLTGLHLYAARNLFVNASAGYLLVPSDMKDLSGFKAGLNAAFSLW